MANMIKPAIIVIAYNREASLKRLLTSLNNAIYESLLSVSIKVIMKRFIRQPMSLTGNMVLKKRY